MKRCVVILSCAAMLMCGCASEFNSVYKSADMDYKYEYAKECFARNKFQQAITLLEELVTIKKGSDEAQECLYMLAMAQSRLDQSPTNGAITAYQQFMDQYPDSKLRPQAQERLYELYDKLIQKEYLSAELYYNLGGYFGNINSNEESNYTSCIITAQNALKNYPYCSLREDFMLLIMKSKFELQECCYSREVYCKM